MKLLALLFALSLVGCSTSIYSPDGKPRFSTYANAASVHYEDRKAGVVLDITELDHSGPTNAAGNTVTKAAMGGAALIMSGGMKP